MSLILKVANKRDMLYVVHGTVLKVWEPIEKYLTQDRHLVLLL